MENELLGANVQEVAELETGLEDIAEESTVATDVDSHKTDENSAFAKIRREKESALNTAAELEQKIALFETESTRLKNTLGKFGYDAEDLTTLADLLEAQMLSTEEQQVSAEEIRAERELKQKTEQEQNALKQQIEDLQATAFNLAMEKELAEINKHWTINSVDELPEDFLRLRANGVSLEVAIKACQPTTPKSPGKLNGERIDNDYYSSAQIDKLTQEELNDPVVWEKVRKSLAKL